MISETMVRTIAEMLIARLPQDAAEKAGELIRRGVVLGDQLDRIEARVAGIEIAIGLMVTAMREQGIFKENSHDAGNAKPLLSNGSIGEVGR